MKITSTEFVTGATGLQHLPRTSLKEIAFLGRSNVGKSSLISSLCRQSQLARSGQKPGKTRELNYFLINNKFHFVDLPGYGFAKMPAKLKNRLGALIESYLKERKNLALAVQLIDARHEPTRLDMMMVGWLEYHQIPFVVVLTKSDKIPRSKRIAHLKKAEGGFSRFRNCRKVMRFSATSGEGRDELLGTIRTVL